MHSLVPRRHIRVHVEPVEVELDDAEGSLLFASLQSAFPSCSGLYYRSGANGSTCRTAVKFDGQKFHAPQGDWENRDYYVTLGGRCSFPFGSYENASKQFERSVNMVQKMMGSVGYKKAKVDDYIIAASPPKTPPSPHERVDTIKDLLKTLA
ncbi:Protein C27H5.2 b, partial [Aphelenchoides avenae]